MAGRAAWVGEHQQGVAIAVEPQVHDVEHVAGRLTLRPQAFARSAPERGAARLQRDAQRLGAGEIVLNCMDSDGVRRGYDLEQLAAVRRLCGVPLVASGGAGEPSHFADVFRIADVDGALAASVFHSGRIRIPELKRSLRAEGVEVRDA